jgi:hypothetical protein
VPVQWVASGARPPREARDARRARLVAPQACDAFGSKPFLPAPNDGLGLAGLPHDLSRAVAVSGQQHNLGAPDMLLRTPIGNDRLQCRAIGGVQGNLGSFVHPPDSHDRVRGGILKNRNVRLAPQFLPLTLACKVLSNTKKDLHVAIIMDGNGRRATARGLPRTAGHRAGVAALQRVCEAAPGIGVTTLSLFHCLPFLPITGVVRQRK